jgi:hypothetical protein
MMTQIFFSSVTAMVNGELESESPIDMLGDSLSNILELFRAGDLSLESQLVYPDSNHSGGGIITLLTKVFECEMIERADSTRQKIKGTGRLLCLIIEEHEEHISQILTQLVESTNSTTDASRQRQLLSSFVAALNLSDVFDPDKMILGNDPKTELKAKIDQMRTKIGVPEDSRIGHSYEKFLRIAQEAWGVQTNTISWAHRMYPEDFESTSEGTSYWWSHERDSARDAFQFERWITKLVGAATASHSVGSGTGSGTGFASADKYINFTELDRGSAMKQVSILVDTVQEYPELIDVESIVMGFNGALFREAWEFIDTEDKKDPSEDMFIAPTDMKMRIAESANGFRMLNSFLKPGTADAIVGRVARFGLLLLQGGDVGDEMFSSSGCQEAFLRVEQQRERIVGGSLKTSVIALLNNIVENDEGLLAARYKAGTRLLRMLQLLCENQCVAWQDELGGSKLGDNIVSHICKILNPFSRKVRERTPTGRCT